MGMSRYICRKSITSFIHIIMKLLLTAVAAFASMACLAAVPENFEVAAPKYSRFVKCNSEDGVNIRKSPSASAPRALYNEAKIEDYDVPVQNYLYWSSGKAGGSIYAHKFTDVAPLVSEPDGWYELYGVGPLANGSFQNGWVSAKYCSVSEVKPITQQVISESPALLRSAGGDKVIYYDADIMNGEYTFYVGKIADGQLVCPYSFNVPSVEETSGKTYFKPNEYGVMLMYCNPAEKDVEGPVLDKLTSETISKILQLAEKADRPITVFSDGMGLSTY